MAAMKTTRINFYIRGPHDGHGVATIAEREAWVRLSRAGSLGEAEEIIHYELGPMLDKRLETRDYVVIERNQR